MKSEEIYQYLWEAHASHLKLDESLNPRSPDLMFETLNTIGIDSQSAVLDVGCGRGNHVCEIAHRFGCHVIGLEPIASNLEVCDQSAAKWKVEERVTFLRGSIDAIPLGSGQFDLLWCRDMLVHIHDLPQGLQECRRVLKPGGFMLVLTTFATELMEPQEQQRLCQALDLAPANLSRQNMEQCFREAGFQIVLTDWLGSELAEFYEERDGRYSRELRRIARLTRKESEFAFMGQSNLEVSLALYTWGIYQLLGKLGVMIYLLK